ncbi:MAG: YdeI/OmpD-associated family protein [Deltaproteobacteria bacterium]|nr:YdeI/OmpD-associated family protein [Deltaproteobacteria bacterium]
MAKKAAQKTSPKVDKFFSWHEGGWVDEIKALRAIALDSGLDEDLKWGWPCYAFEGGNVVLIHAFKEYVAYLFFKGAILDDPEGILIQQTENVQAARQIRLKSLAEIKKNKKVLADYIERALKLEKAGLKVKLKKHSEYTVPEELQKALDDNPALERAFEALTPGRQRGYIYYVSQAKQSKTREDRVKKHTPRILAGKGIDD